MKKLVLMIAIIPLLAGSGALLSSRSGGEAPPVPSVAAPAVPRIYGLGTVEARTLSQLGFEVTGTVVEWTVDQGDTVTRGQILARLDARQQQARVGLAEAGLRQAQAALPQAEARLERARAVREQRQSINERRQVLARRGTISIEDAEDARTSLATAAADVAVAASDVEAARAGIHAAQAELQLEEAVFEKFVLSAPYDGVVVERQVELGATVAPGAAAFTVAVPATIWVRAYVDEALAGGLRVGQKAEITLRSQPGSGFSGKVARIDRENDRVSEERRVHLAFDSVPDPFYLGEQAEVWIDGGESGR